MALNLISAFPEATDIDASEIPEHAAKIPWSP
jgi:hypothetical protein